MTETRTTRSVAIDAVRVLGLVAIVAGHNWGDRDWVNTWLYTWHVPVFFVITGYLWKPDRTTGYELRARFRTLIVPYLVWLAVVTAIWFTVRAFIGWPITGELVANVARGGWYAARPYSAFWFITALFFAAVIMRAAERLHPLLPLFVGVFGVIWAMYDPIAMKSLWFGLGLALPGIAFMCIGRGVAMIRDTIRHPFLVGLVLLIPAFYLGASSTVPSINMKSGILGAPFASVFMAASISVGMLIAQSVEHLLPDWSRTMILLGAAVALPLLFLHTLVMQLFVAYGYELTKWTFLAALIIPVIVGLALRRTPVRQYVM